MAGAFNSSRIAINTLMLYIRMLLLIAVQLYTVPIILKSLGVSDFGLYNVVGGVVTLFSFIGVSLASGSQRFMAYALGRGDNDELKRVFDSTFTLYLIFAVIAILFMETIGLWFINYKMDIASDRLYAARWVFQLSLLTFVVNLISIPYNSAVIAHEKMSIYAYVSILECLLKLIIAIMLPRFFGDKLIAYAILLCLVSIIIRVIYQIYCSTRFIECKKISLDIDKKLGKELLAYSGWNVVGSSAMIFRQQGINIVVNLFFGTLLNAAHSIAQQINGVLIQLINNVYVATRPQITKLYASGQYEDMWNLTLRSSKFVFFLALYICVPLLLEIDQLLVLWLNDVPKYTSQISFLMIATLLIETLVNQIIGVFQAANRIKSYQIFSSSILLLNIPLSYLFLRFFLESPLAPYAISCLLSIVYIISILIIAKQEIKIQLRRYISDVIFKDVLVFAISYCLTFILINNISPTIFRIFITIIISVIVTTSTIWFLGLDSLEKSFIKNYIHLKTKQI